MKPFPVFLVNLATVVVALVVYDQLRSEGSSRGRASRTRATDTAELEARIRALETQRRTSPVENDAHASGRLDGPASNTSRRAAPGDPSPATKDGAKPVRGAQPSGTLSSDAPTEDEVRRFRRLREHTRRLDSVKRNRKKVSEALKKLPINLTDEQRELVHYKYAAFEPVVSEIWGEVKQAAQATVKAGGEVDRGEIVATATTTIQAKFAATLGDVVDHDADAQAIAAALHPNPMNAKR